MDKISRVARTISVVGLFLALGLLAACSSATGTTSTGTGATPSGGGTASETPAQPPTLQVVQPGAGGEVAAGTVTVAVEATGLEFVMASTTNVSGQGHLHLTLDDQPVVMSIEQEARLTDVAPGPHKLVVELVQNDTTPFEPPVRQEIEFTAK